MKFRSLKMKFLFFSVGGTLVFAVLISWIVHNDYRSGLELELRRRADILARGLSVGVQKSVLTDNRAAIKNLVGYYKSMDEDIVYIVITDSEGNILQHTFEGGFPGDLLPLTRRRAGEPTAIPLETEAGPVEHVIRGILGGQGGYVHIGLSSAGIRDEINNNLAFLILIVTGICAAGIIVIGFLSTGVTRSITKVISAAGELGEGRRDIRIEVETSDETGQLARAFNKMSQSIEENHQRVLQAEKLAAIGRLAAGVAHEINNPIMGIRNSFNLIAGMSGLPEKASKYIELIDGSLSGMEKVVRNLLVFSRPRQEEWRVFTPTEIIRNTHAFIEHMANAIGVEFQFEFCSTPQPVFGSPHEFQQVIINMFMNAVDAMPEGGSVTISTACVPGGDFVEIGIRDTGEGISGEHLDKIFDPFYTTKDTGRGTGLGLYVCHEIIKNMGGDITVKSRPGEGTAFSIRLPVAGGQVK